MKLSDLTIPKAVKREPLKIDLSTITGQEGAVIVLREPSTADTFGSVMAAQELQKSYPDWGMPLLVSIATLGECHEEPRPEAEHPAFFYARLASDNKPIFTYILGAFQKAFPDQSLAEAVEQAKNA